MTFSRFRVSFGDCDPAGIAYYPNMFRWVDATFHAFLQDEFGGHAALCDQLGAKGLGLVKAEADFRAPINQGCDLVVQIDDVTWNERTFKIRYVAKVESTKAFEATETRAVFVMKEGRMAAGETELLRKTITAHSGL